MNRRAFLWPIERIDASGEPSPAGSYLKFGFRQQGAASAIWVDAMDAEALATAILQIMSGAPRALPAKPPGVCERCEATVAPGAPAYQAAPGGAPCFICEACAPTVEAETAHVGRLIEAGVIVEGFHSRGEAIAWRAFTRLAYAPDAKRLSPYLAAPAPDFDLTFPEPPPSAAIVESLPDDE